MQVNFSDKEILYMYSVLLRDLAKLEKLEKLNRKDIKVSKQLIATLEKDNPELKLLANLRQDKKSQNQNPLA